MEVISEQFKKNTILDNTESYKMADMINDYLSSEKYYICKIATGFWDIPGLVLLCNKMRDFLERNRENKIQLIKRTIKSKNKQPK